GLLNDGADLIDFGTGSQNGFAGEALLNLFTQVLVFLNQLLLARLQFGKRQTIFQGNGCLICESLDETFVVAREPPFAFAYNLEDTDDFLFRIAQRYAQDISGMEAREGINRLIEERRFVCVFDDYGFAC